MSLKDLDLKDTYWSGENNIIKNFYMPCLKESIYYDRAVGFFSSSILQYISEGLFKFIANGGKMRLICSPKLSEKDVINIKKGYNARDIINNSLKAEVNKLIDYKNEPNVNNLFWLIKNNRLDIKICLKSLEYINYNENDDILFHEKFGIFKDENNNIVSFMGSINESVRGWMFNEESFEVSFNWKKALENRVLNKVNRFNKLWRNKANKIITYDFPVAIKKKIINEAPEDIIRKLSYNQYNISSNYGKVQENRFDFEPRKCQEEAYEKFENQNKILFEMSTGSGKTLAALYSISKKDDWKFLLILVPTKELVEQWEKDVKLFFPDDYLIKCMSDYSDWKENLIDILEARVPVRTIAISTYQSASSEFAMDKWKQISNKKFALIADEAHNLGGNKIKKIMNLNPTYRIGLSATPERNFDEKGTQKINNFFNNNTYIYTIREAIDDNYLVEYYYYIYPVFLTEIEWEDYKKLTKEIKKLSFLRDKDDGDEEYNSLQHKYMQRAKILKTAENKLIRFSEIIEKIPSGNRILIYADSKEHLNDYAIELKNMNKEYFVYTGDKDTSTERPAILNQFKLGSRKILLAINCLDEGIDIPVCDSAIFISSSTSKREFIQRRGRVLRKSPGKDRAYLYDYLVIPPYDKSKKKERKIAKQVIKKEYERISIIAEDAINGVKEQNKIDDYLEKIGLGVFQY